MQASLTPYRTPRCNENLWYVLADANGLTEASPLSAGTTLTAPEVKTTSNDASTFKPYDPGEITGPTTPNMAYMPPPDAGCGTVGMVIMIAIMVIVTIYTAGALTGATANLFAAGLSAGAGAAAGGAAIGSFVGQVAGNMMGVADGISFKDIAVAAVTAGIGAGISQGLGAVAQKAGGATHFATHTLKEGTTLTALGHAVKGVGTYAAGAVTNKAMGRSSDFSWRGVAAAALGSAASSAIGGTPSLVTGFGKTTDSFFANLQGSVIDGVVNAGTRKLLGAQDDIDWSSVAVDAFGNAIGSTIVGRQAQRGMQLAALQESLTAGQARTLAKVQGETYGLIDAKIRDANGQLVARGDARLQAMLDSKMELAFASVEGANVAKFLSSAAAAQAANVRAERLILGSLLENKGWGVLRQSVTTSTTYAGTASDGVHIGAEPPMFQETKYRLSATPEPGLLEQAWHMSPQYLTYDLLKMTASDAMLAVGFGEDLGEGSRLRPFYGTEATAREIQDAKLFTLTSFIPAGRIESAAANAEKSFMASMRRFLSKPEIDDVGKSAERSLGARFGHQYADEVLPGGSGTAYAGHGEYVYGSGSVVVPEGAAVTLPRPGIRILDETGRYIEAGDWEGLARAAQRNPRIASDIDGMATYLPGAEIPNYTLSAPSRLTILQNSATVESRGSLDSLLKPDIGCVQWAACTWFTR